ncbi:ISL3 family transposase [Acidithiobacillus caldus]|uniref:ISL3 family transposase n=1 Tax=Acidithiobacillus caldus TaxID=33059 RepID=UPI001C074D7C|nr:ISL3 family transposase [Acidithiobacillus caldus]MBU2782322.1 ISL3 family transposase [Acidithiobacillus caldus]
MPDFLHLPNLHTLAAQDMGDHYLVVAEGGVVPTTCPACHNALYRHGSQRQTYLDTPMHGKRVVIELNRKRYRCKACGKTMFEPLPAMDSKRLATTRLVEHIERHCLRKTFAELSREVGVDDKTIRHIFDDYVARLKKTVVFETPEVLGIDELKIIGNYRAMITNVERLALFDMLPTRNKADLIAYFKTMPGKEKVKILTMDLWNVYRQVAQDQFPGRMVVADRFHVVRMANDSLEKVRKTIRKELETRDRLKLKDDRFVLLAREKNLDDKARAKLEMWTEMFPVLGAAYKAKEAFHDIYQHHNKVDAQKAAQEWLDSMDKDVAWAFTENMVALRNWWTEIFNYFDFPISNAYTESINNIAKWMNRMGRGYSFDVIRARLLFDEARKDTRTTIRKKVRKAVRVKARESVKTPMVELVTRISMSSTITPTVRYKDVYKDVTVEYGPYLPTLARKLEAGDFA